MRNRLVTNGFLRLAQPQRGVALAMLLWFVAAMSLLVGAIVMQARVDVKLTQLHSNRARAEAVADGAIQLGLAEWLSLVDEEALLAERGLYRHYVIGGLDVAVHYQPLSGLVNLNLATTELLFLLFSSVGQVEENEALELAEAVLEWRTAAPKDDDAIGNDGLSPVVDPTIRNGRFEAVEDLLLVPGIKRQHYDALRDLLYVGQQGQSGVDWMTAPAAVLGAIGGDVSEQELERLVAERAVSGQDSLGPPAGLELGFQENRRLPLFRADAIVTIGESRFLRRRFVNRRETGPDGLPWAYFRSEAVRAAPYAMTGSEGTADAGL